MWMYLYFKIHLVCVSVNNTNDDDYLKEISFNVKKII